MNRRQFLTTVGGATAGAATLLHINQAFAAESTTALYAKGLIMVSFEDPKVLRLGMPKAPGHKATLSLVPQKGTQRLVNLKGASTFETAEMGAGKPDYKVPEMIRLQEIYGNNIHSRVADCPTVISIPYAAIKSIAAVELSPTSYTFVRADNGKEIQTFRPRKVAETLRIELSSDAVMKLDSGKTSVALNTMKELHAEYAPEDPAAIAGIDAFTAHFPHYNAYLVRPSDAQFDVLPRNLGPTPTATPRIGNNFAPPYWPYYMCFIVSL
jgi:hypothetical protein